MKPDIERYEAWAERIKPHADYIEVLFPRVASDIIQARFVILEQTKIIKRLMEENG